MSSTLGRVSTNGKVFCPFHHNVNTPAAKIYDEINIMKCFACNKSYTAYDFVVNYDSVLLDKIKSTIILPETGYDTRKINLVDIQGKSLIQILRCIKQK